MYGNCLRVRFLVGFIFLLITRRLLVERIIFSREICVGIVLFSGYPIVPIVPIVAFADTSS